MDVLPVGPYRTVRSGKNEIPWYIVPFDAEGRCQGPETRAHLISSLESGDFSDVYLFSHGWNNDWNAATDRYNSFVEGFLGMRKRFHLTTPDGYKPLLVGIYWPSTVLVTESEKGPEILADQPDSGAIAEERRRISELAAEVAPDKRERFYALVQKPQLGPDESRELAGLLSGVYCDADNELPDSAGTPNEDEIVERWAASVERKRKPASKKTAGSVTLTSSGSPVAAGWVHDVLLSPREIVRGATVYQMKDRAGKVGANGVRKLVEDVLMKTDARLHLIGHSYGAKLVLSALVAATIARPGRQAESMLLLQPAVSHLCFAEQVPGTSKPGGYREALQRVRKPVLATYSTHDVPLRRLFHRALWRGADKGEVRIAANSNAPPNKYAALGGYGPRKSGEKLIDIVRPPVPYELDPKTPLFGIDGSVGISGHGDVTNQFTWWTLYWLVGRA
jgi:hypothetical protein